MDDIYQHHQLGLMLKKLDSLQHEYNSLGFQSMVQSGGTIHSKDRVGGVISLYDGS